VTGANHVPSHGDNRAARHAIRASCVSAIMSGARRANISDNPGRNRPRQ
jgi:hypothetical protein